MAERNPSNDRAAFGVFPQLKRNRSKQDREAAKNVPVDLARGAISGVLGAPGDIESLIRMLPYIDEKTILPTSEDIEKKIPFKSDTPVSRAATGLGQLGGGFYYGPGSPLKVVGALPKAIKHGAEEFAKASVAGAPHVVKPKGGNWLSGQDRLTVPENDLRRLKVDTMMGGQDDTVESLVSKKDAINKWIDSNLKNYVKKEMGTPEDPVRKLAEEGIIHTRLRDDSEAGDFLKAVRVAEGFPAEGMGRSPLAKQWEDLADDSIRVTKAGAIQEQANTGAKLAKARAELEAHKKQIDQDFLARMSDLAGNQIFGQKGTEMLLKMPFVQKAEILGDTRYRDLQGNVNELLARESGFEKAAGDLNPFVAKLDPETRLYSGSTYDLGFDHIIDVLKQDVAAGRIRPEQLNKVSMEQAVRRTFEYDQEMAKKMAEAAIKQTEGFPLHKEYPEGYRWIELTNPKAVPEGYTLPEGMKLDTIDHPRYGLLHTVSDPKGITQIEATDSPESALLRFYNRNGGEGYKALEDALKYEGDTMGHCVGGYCPDVSAGRSRIYSLRDAKGEPHVTVETAPHNPSLESVYAKQNHPELYEKYKANKNDYFNSWQEFLRAEAPELLQNRQEKIIQIKGKQNAAPKADYLPYVQDFVQGGNWSEVGDLRNTSMVDMNTYRNLSNWLKERGIEHPRYVTKEQFGKHEGDYLLDELKPPTPPDVPPAEGMKRGGVVVSNNPDAMMLELGNKRMKQGGSEDDTKPYFGGAGTKKYAAAKKRAEQADVNQLKDPKTYAAIMGLLGEAPDQMGFSVLHPDYQGIKEVAEPAFYAGTALGVAPVAKAFKAPAMALGRAGEKYAEKVVPQIMERGGLGAEILGGLAQGSRSYAYLPHTEKNPNPLVGTRYKTQHVGNLAPKTDFDIQAEQGSSVMSNPWDLTSRGEQVLEVSDIPLTNQIITEGGHDFARDLANIQANIGGASGRQIAERMQDRVNDAHFANLFDKGTGRVFTMPSTMDVKGSHFSTMPTDIVMDIFQQAGLKPKDVEKITDDLRTFVFEGDRNKFANAAPVGSPEFLLQLRQGGKGFSAGDLRKGLMDRMSQKEYQKMLGFNIEDVYGAIGDQSLKGLPKGFVGNTMIETSPFADVIPATHQSYDTANLGKYAGSMPSMPLELMMPDLFRAIEINYLKDPKYRKLTPMQLRTMIVNTIEKRGNVISQPINQRVVDNVMRYQEGLKQGHFKPNDYEGIMKFMQATGGYKEGGEVTKPASGVKQPAAYIDGNEFVLAAKKYGIKDSMNNLNKIVDLVNKGLSVDDAARQVADTGMHKAAGGAITGDDLIIEERPL